MNTILHSELAHITPEALLERLGMNAPPFNPFEIAKSLGVSVDQTLTFDNADKSGSITNADGKPIVWLNPLDPDTRQRFTLAHELGHYVNDILTDGTETIVDTPDTLYRNGNSCHREVNANTFAGRLLMPKAHIIAEATKLLQNSLSKEMEDSIFIKKMSNIFAVSNAAMAIRLKRLGIIKECC